ncbi:MAG: hypothetical protein A3A86_04640 [Elusimicrobia bacterium RIFCSPLOWO2_01_FULL_60_11]|nr:MAG: hypothetical protein A3A86_04640 [Elusimicrobia bacterium RIFCSPLOWO2_01_FULL_60_11]
MRTGLVPAALGLLFLGGCGNLSDEPPLDSASPPAYDDSFIESSIGDASYLNPVLSSDSASGSVNGAVFNGLVKYDENIHITGDLAERWEVSQGGRVITFHLRKGVLWHDGAPFTAEDVLYTYERLKDPDVKTPHSSNFDKVLKVEAPDAWTVKVTYSEPYVPALESWGMGIVPKHVFGGAKGKDFNEHPANKSPVGTGPYRFKEWKVDEKIVLEANPDCFEGRPHIKRYIFRVIPDNSVEFLELRNKSIDTMLLTPDQYRAYGEFFEGYKRYRLPRGAYTYFAFNLGRPLFRGRNVRLALAHAVNKAELVDAVVMGLGRSASGPFLPLSWAYDPSVKDFEYDPALAVKLLAQEGWKDSDGDGILDKDGKPFAFTVVTNQGNKMRSLSAEIIQQQLKKIGVRMDIRVIEWSAFIKNFVDKKNFDALILGWTISPDPDQYSIWHSSQKKEGQYNFVGYGNPEVDRILEDGRREFDPQKRKRLYQKMHRIVHDDLPYIFLYYPDYLPVVHRRVEGIQMAPLSTFGFGWNFDKWFVREKNVRYPVRTAQ